MYLLTSKECVCVKYEGLRYQVDRGKRQEFEKHLGDIFWQILFCDTFTIDILLCILLSCPADWVSINCFFCVYLWFTSLELRLQQGDINLVTALLCLNAFQRHIRWFNTSQCLINASISTLLIFKIQILFFFREAHCNRAAHRGKRSPLFETLVAPLFLKLLANKF